MKRRWINWSNFWTLVMTVYLIAMVVNPNVKAWTIRQLMRVGLFQPDVDAADFAGHKSEDGQQLPLFVYTSAEGVQSDLTQLKGKVVFINFWATWCPPCIAEMPSIQKLYYQLGKNGEAVFLMVDVDKDFAKSSAFKTKHRYDLPIVHAVGSVDGIYTTGTIPTTLVLDKSGKMVFRHEGAAEYANPDFINFMKKLSGQ